MGRVLAGRARLVGLGWVRGRLYDLGPYPGLKETPDPDQVRGEVYELADPEATLSVLDAYESCGPDDRPRLYERRLAPVVLDSGERRSCWVYYYLGPVVEERRIRSGDYARKEV